MKQNKWKILKIVLFIITFAIGLLLGVNSCKSVKQSTSSYTKTESTTELNLQEKTTAGTNLEQIIVSEQFTENNQKTSDTGIVDETIVEVSETTTFSAPDSSGKQYPLSKTKSKKETVRGEKKNLQTANEQNLFEKSVSSLENHSEITADMLFYGNVDKEGIQKEKSKNALKSETPAWAFLGIFLLLGSLAFFIYKILKRYNLIK